VPDVRDLYQQVIFDHHKHPRNFRDLPQATGRAEGHNPLCGDRVVIMVEVRDGLIQDIAFQGAGCAISRASASMMTDALRGKTLAEAEALFEKFHRLVKGELAGEEALAELGKLAAFSGVSEFPVRVKCASLAWHTFHAALENQEKPVTTE
jgi:nitrogen fixation protein NifU and related proteins